MGNIQKISNASLSIINEDSIKKITPNIEDFQTIYDLYKLKAVNMAHNVLREYVYFSAALIILFQSLIGRLKTLSGVVYNFLCGSFNPS